MYIVLIYECNSINEYKKLNLVSISIRFQLFNSSRSAELILDLVLNIFFV